LRRVSCNPPPLCLLWSSVDATALLVSKSHTILRSGLLQCTVIRGGVISFNTSTHVQFLGHSGTAAKGYFSRFPTPRSRLFVIAVSIRAPVHQGKLSCNTCEFRPFFSPFRAFLFQEETICRFVSVFSVASCPFLPRPRVVTITS